MERRLQRLNWMTIQRLVPAECDTVILPVGTLEAHGSACVGTDNVIPETIADGIADRIGALVVGRDDQVRKLADTSRRIFPHSGMRTDPLFVDTASRSVAPPKVGKSLSRRDLHTVLSVLYMPWARALYRGLVEAALCPSVEETGLGRSSMMQVTIRMSQWSRGATVTA